MQIIKERNKNRKLGVYVKQDFSQTRQERIELLKQEVGNLKKNIEKKKKEVSEFESRQVKYINSLSSLDMFLKQVKLEIKEFESNN